VFQIASGRETTVNELTEKVKRLAEENTKRSVYVRYESAGKGEIYKNVADVSKARRIIVYKPQVSLEKGLEETLAWFQSMNGQISII